MTRDQLFAFHRSTNACEAPWAVSPTAKQVVAPGHARPVKKACFGLTTIDQRVPFQCSTSVALGADLLDENVPIARQLVGLAHAALDK